MSVVGGAGVVPGVGLGHLQTQHHRIVRHAFILLDRLNTIDSTRSTQHDFNMYLNTTQFNMIQF